MVLMVMGYFRMFGVELSSCFGGGYIVSCLIMVSSDIASYLRLNITTFRVPLLRTFRNSKAELSIGSQAD